MGKGSEKRAVAVWATVLVGTALSLWACTRGGSPTGATAAGEGTQVADGVVRGLATVGATPTPVGPTGIPIGPGSGQVGPSAHPVGPSPRPIGPSATPVGGGTPPPPEGPPPTPGAGCSDAGVKELAFSGLPVTVSGAVFLGGLDIAFPDCRIDSVELVLFAVTSDNLGAFQNFSARLLFTGASSGTSASVFDRGPGASGLQGNLLGTRCGDLVFADDGVSFPPDTIPYVGRFRPSGTIGSTGFAVFRNRQALGSFGFDLDWTPGPSLTVQCVVLRVEIS
jgi:hypothetical protein